MSLDQLYRPLTVSQYQRYAEQVPRTSALWSKPQPGDRRAGAHRRRPGPRAQPAFLNPELALREFVEPALEGLGSKVGALVFQISPLPMALLDRMPQVLEQLRAMLQALPPLASRAPDGVIAVEVRDPEWLTPEFAAVLRNAGATYCPGLHPKLPPLADQLPLLRALWPTPLVCRWNLNEVHGPYGYEDAEKRYAPYDRLHDLDPATHEALAKVIVGITGRPERLRHHQQPCRGLRPLTVQRLAGMCERCNISQPRPLALAG